MGKGSAVFLILGFLCAMLLSGCGSSEEYPKSEIIFEGEYVLEGTENIEFIFYKDSTLKVVQSGVYEFSKGENGNLLRICFDDTSRELPEDYSYTDYQVEQKGRYVYLTFFSENVEEEQQPMMLKLLSGTDGLAGGEYFTGTYQIGRDGDSYQYIFSEDGTVVLQIKERYYAKDDSLTLSDDSGSTDYKYELTDEQMKINNLMGETILSLRKK